MSLDSFRELKKRRYYLNDKLGKLKKNSLATVSRSIRLYKTSKKYVFKKGVIKVLS